ncbi:DUF5689 domain-containing protein [Salegentibacter sp. F188]|uniref:DUF5689 domain-containing protein n=1 Tax=Autumnicola patrickiae TaxID=3075591 RepID=A0ABU3E5E3_9FLAO|nr:DUF5689 domain-containing protein [Salegentibacter sp. F188]MDT0691194.1 DUF5689 domain-containing protein [Salegentibacter sp. F188]
MKRKFYLTLNLTVISLLLLNSCVTTDDYDLPEIDNIEVDFEGNLTSISAVKGSYDPVADEIYTFQNTDTYFEGFVVSSDEGGNFYKELVLQDKPENPLAGIVVLVDENSLHETFNFGRKIYVKLDGLSLGYNNGLLQLGIQNRGDVVAIPNSMIDEHLIRSEQTAEIIPLRLKISDFREQYKNLFVQVENVQFNRNLVRDEHIFSFASETIDEYDGERQLESCESGATAVLSTSTFADFKALLLPQQSGSVKAVLSRNFYDDFYALVVNTPEDLNFSGERCDPEFFKCGDNETMGPEVLFNEDFTDVSTLTALNSRGWKNLNVSGGSEKFKPGTRNGNRYFRISAYNTTENPLEAWLVTPEINLDGTSGEVFSADILASFDNATILEIYVTTNFTGNPKTTEWQLLDGNIPVGPSNQNGTVFRNSKIDISCLEGTVNFGFRYHGAVPDKTTTYDVDNVRVTGY